MLDILFISLLSFLFLGSRIFDLTFFIALWVVLSLFFSFYEVYRFTKVIKIISLLSKQIIVFILSVVSYFYIIGFEVGSKKLFLFTILNFIVLIIWRIFIHLIFRKYRVITGSNYKKVLVIGSNDSTKRLEQFFNTKPGYGYKYAGFFTNNDIDNKKGNINDSYEYVIDQEIDEIYCSVKELTNDQIKEFIEFCDVNVKVLKFIPDNDELYAKNLHLDYYDLIPILSLRQIPLEDYLHSFTKRLFDIVFSLLVICFILSWLIPVLGLVIKLESKGPIFFRQNRPGIKEKGFGCYKFRSMGINSRSEDSAARNDPRVTKVGKFIRKTSIDELPQFFNVLFGSMSVVGPRPHLWKQNEMYGTKISKYMVRYFVKPGITGLAQVRGYRGEIETKHDIVNRTKYDIFYIENWSLLMDFNIIVQTVLNVVQGEDKAY